MQRRTDVPDEGPLDPSVFDGIFDDLEAIAQAQAEQAASAPEPQPEADAEEPDEEPGAEDDEGPDAESTGTDGPESADPTVVFPQVEPAAPPVRSDEAAADRPDEAHPILDQTSVAAGVAQAEPDLFQTTRSAMAEQPRLPARRQKTRRWPAFVVAVLIGATLGVGGAYGLSEWLRSGGFGSQTAEQANPTQAADQPTVSVDQTTASGQQVTGDDQADTADGASGDDPARSMAALAMTGRLELNSVRFVPGTETLTDDSADLLDQMAEAVTQEATARPTTVTVRSYGASSAAENLELSRRQAEVVRNELADRGLDETAIRAVGIGAPPLTTSQPVQNFVVPGTGLGRSQLADAIADISPFAIGLDPVSNQLRPESYQPLARLAEALAADPDAELGFAAYWFAKADGGRNREMAAAASEAAIAHLVTTYGIDRSRLTTVVASERQFIVGSDVGGHVTIRWGSPAEALAPVTAEQAAALAFSPGSAQVGDDARQAVVAVAEAVANSDMTLVVEVHSATESTANLDRALSVRQADALSEAFADAGLAAERVRVFGGGRLRQFSGDRPSQVVLTAVS